MNEIGFYMNFNGNKHLGDTVTLDDMYPTIKNVVDIVKELPCDWSSDKISKKEFKAKASTFYKDTYDTHKIGLLNSRWSIHKINRWISKEIPIDELIDKYNQLATFIDPFDLPINYVPNYREYGALGYQNYFFNDLYPAEIIKGINVYFKNITVDKKTTEMSVPYYLHEITHSQIDSNKGTIGDFYHEELLSIFNELLYSYNHSYELFIKNLNLRLRYAIQEYNAIVSCLNGKIPREGYEEKDCYHSKKYIISTLKAFNLMYLYTKAPKSGVFLNEINKVLNGEMKLEELLSNMNVTADTMLNADNVRNLL